MGDYDNNGQDDDLSLPKATVTKLINEMMPPDVICARDTRDILIDCCVEFIQLIASEANELCEKDMKKTIAAEHIIASLKSLGFEQFIPEVEDVMKDHKLQQKVEREKKGSRFENSGKSEEELLRDQIRLFEEAKLKYQAQQQSFN